MGKNGFGHEDWNFAKDIWEDGRCHLYLRGRPAKGDQGKRFHIALGERTPLGHALIGFCENVRYETSRLDVGLWEVRAKQVKSLTSDGSLSAEWAELSNSEIAQELENGPEQFSYSVSPEDFVILETPALVPTSIVSNSYNRYQLRRLTEAEYGKLRKIAEVTWTAPVDGLNDEVDGFPEGATVARMHYHRERSPKLIRDAKERFKKKHGSLFCEACHQNPDKRFQNANLNGSIIEVHHDIWLSLKEHGGKTKPEDLKLLCPTCHRAIHKTRPWLRVEEFRKRFFLTA